MSYKPGEPRLEGLSEQGFWGLRMALVEISADHLPSPLSSLDIWAEDTRFAVSCGQLLMSWKTCSHFLSIIEKEPEEWCFIFLTAFRRGDFIWPCVVSHFAYHLESDIYLFLGDHIPVGFSWSGMKMFLEGSHGGGIPAILPQLCPALTHHCQWSPAPAPRGLVSVLNPDVTVNI
jgi:hypothetical protein